MSSFATFPTLIRGIHVITHQFKLWKLQGDVTVQTKKMIDIHYICADECIRDMLDVQNSIHLWVTIFALVSVGIFFLNSVSSNPALFYMTFLINSPLLCCEASAAKDRMNTAKSYLKFSFKIFGSWHRFETFVFLRFYNSKWWLLLENVVSSRDPRVLSWPFPLLLKLPLSLAHLHLSVSPPKKLVDYLSPSDTSFGKSMKVRLTTIFMWKTALSLSFKIFLW